MYKRQAVVDGKTEDTEENFTAEVASWQTKRERGADYVMGTGTWDQQMDKFEETFVGMTVDEVEDWFEKYCSDLNGRPLKDGSDKEEDKAKYDACLLYTSSINRYKTCPNRQRISL